MSYSKKYSSFLPIHLQVYSVHQVFPFMDQCFFLRKSRGLQEALSILESAVSVWWQQLVDGRTPSKYMELSCGF